MNIAISRIVLNSQAIEEIKNLLQNEISDELENKYFIGLRYQDDIKTIDVSANGPISGITPEFMNDFLNDFYVTFDNYYGYVIKDHVLEFKSDILPNLSTKIIFLVRSFDDDLDILNFKCYCPNIIVNYQAFLQAVNDATPTPIGG